MRVRLFVVGTGRRADVIHLEHFPSVLAEAPNGVLSADVDGDRRTLCELDEVDGHLMLRDRDDEHHTLVNGLPMASGPLLPGDRLKVGSKEVVVSYERTSHFDPPEPVYHFAE